MFVSVSHDVIRFLIDDNEWIANGGTATDLMNANLFEVGTLAPPFFFF